MPPNLRPSPFLFKFGDLIRKRSGKMEFTISLPNESYLPITADVVDADISLLIGIDFMDREGILPI